ncbi:MAG: DUF308 domain-containing protein [Muribaculum sp.]|nr:DUF308 domain-containing protein [Muribaculum sp.]MDE6458989.1 DUF308 domain-containing protein [Muribaculum sp.]
MSGKNSFWSYLFVLAAGIVLICFHTRVNILAWLIMFVGVMFAVPGLIGVITGISRSSRNRGVNASTMISSIGSLIIGVIMIIWPEPFAGVFVYVLAAVLLIAGFCQIWVLAVDYKPYSMPLWLYILPVLIFITGIVMICTPLREIESAFTLMAGIAMVAAAANGLFIYLAAYNSAKPELNEAKQHDTIGNE